MLLCHNMLYICVIYIYLYMLLGRYKCKLLYLPHLSLSLPLVILLAQSPLHILIK